MLTNESLLILKTMTEANEMRKNVMLGLNNLVSCDTEEPTEEQQSFSCQEEAASDDIPLSLLNYFKTSKSRAAVCEKLIFEDLEDFTALNLPAEFNKDKKLKEQVLCATENEDEGDLLNTLTDEEEAGTDVETLALKLSEHKAEAKKRHSEEEEQRKQRELDFQEELRRLIETEKLQQMELELMEKRAQQKLEQELLLQQEVISNLQKQVEQEKKRIEGEQKRIEEEQERKMMEEEERRKKEEEDEKKRKEMDKRRKKEEEDERKRKKMEQRRKKREDERKMKEMEERRAREEEERKIQKERKVMELKKAEEERRKTVELRFKEEEDRRKEEEEQMKLEEQEGKKVEERNMKEMQIKGEKKHVIELAGKTTGDETKEGETRTEDKGPEENVGVKMKQEKRKNEEEREDEEVGRKMLDDQKKSEEKENGTNEDKVLSEREGERTTCEDKRLMRENKNTNREEEIKTKEEEQVQEEGRNTEKEQEGNKCDDERRTRDKDKIKDERKKQDNGTEKKEDREEVSENREGGDRKRKQDTSGEEELMMMMTKELQKKNEEKTIGTDDLNQGHSAACETSPTSTPSSPETTQKHEASDHGDPAVASSSSPVCLPEHTEQKRLSWMRDCISWSNLSLHNRRRQRGAARSRRGLRRTADTCGLPPLCPDTLLQAAGWRTLQEVTTVTLEDLPGCSLSTLAQCAHLQSLTLRRCGLKSLEGISQLQELCYIDLQENDISFVDCENMKSLRVLRLSHNKLTSIHGLSGADNLDVLELSHNSITRIAGLESMMRLQKLSLDHNQLISTKGLRDVLTLLHLDCSHNHLASVDGLENNALLHTLDLTANNLTEPPGLNNQVLLRELHLDDNSIASLQGLSACWLPLMQQLTVSQNRIMALPSMSDFVSLEYLDLRFNCLSDLQNMCENLEGCQFLRDVHLTGNPLQRENGWRSTLQKALPGLRSIDGQQTDSFLLPPAVQQVGLASGGFLTFCQAQLQKTRDLQQRHRGDLSDASPLDAVKSFCRHLTMSLNLAEQQRFAHEYGDTAVSDGHEAGDQPTSEKAVGVDALMAEMESTNKIPAVGPSGDNMRCCDQSFERRPTAEMGLTAERKTTSFSLEKAPVSSGGVLQLKNKAAVMIQQQWRKYKQKCGNTNAPSVAKKGGERGGDGSKPESGSSYINSRVSGQDYAATVIQALWRGFALRRRLASALAAATQPDAEEDDTLEEVDVDEFVFDEAALEEHWTLTLPEDPPPRNYSVSLKPPAPYQHPSQYILPAPRVLSPKQAWMAGDQEVASAEQRNSPESFNRGKSPASPSVLSGLSERSEKILEEWGFTDSHTALLMLKRAQKMKSRKHQEKTFRDPAVRLALFRNCNYQLGPVEARNRRTPHHRSDVKDGEAPRAFRQAEKTEQMKVKQWLRTQSERLSESEHFLPEISSFVLNGGRVQLMADPAYTDRLHQASGLWANNSSAAQPCNPSSYPRRNSLGHARKEPPSPKRVVSAPSKKERISFRDNPVNMSGGWGGGKKRDRVHK
ncbi:leucine-rich repeat and IQ domain-containing protein 1 [Parambassis ranga]|uniref:Leucine-rich repeat and IQ domain-containing protein 1 n=1 Tax=Parambassis ranga TaxID=210632 RepID=A0A6P7KG17_9TELE|nr:leucine-rich repeat and IQ domain-containing protein 1 [Parambassis ranga]